jgi:hypothetical protein
MGLLNVEAEENAKFQDGLKRQPDEDWIRGCPFLIVIGLINIRISLAD